MTLNFGNNLFPERGEILVNYDWINVTEATGYIEFDCYSTYDSTGRTSGLIRTSNASSVKSITEYSINNYTPYNIINGTQSSDADWTKTLDADFDLTEFKLPQIIKGTGYIRLSYFVNGTSSGTNSRIIAKVRKWDGSSETEIASVQSDDLSHYDVEKPLSMMITIPQTHFKIGETLRLTIEGWGKDTGATSYVQISIAGDPSNAEGTTSVSGVSISENNTRIVFICPFKINL